MLKPKSRWKLKESSKEIITSICEELNLSPFIAQLLATRGIETVEEADKFLHAEKQAFHDPFLIDSMGKAVERIQKAIQANEQILIFGDYDAGATRF